MEKTVVGCQKKRNEVSNRIGSNIQIHISEKTAPSLHNMEVAMLKYGFKTRNEIHCNDALRRAVNIIAKEEENNPVYFPDGSSEKWAINKINEKTGTIPQFQIEKIFQYPSGVSPANRRKPLQVATIKVDSEDAQKGEFIIVQKENGLDVRIAVEADEIIQKIQLKHSWCLKHHDSTKVRSIILDLIEEANPIITGKAQRYIQASSDSIIETIEKFMDDMIAITPKGYSTYLEEWYVVDANIPQIKKSLEDEVDKEIEDIMAELKIIHENPKDLTDKRIESRKEKLLQKIGKMKTKADSYKDMLAEKTADINFKLELAVKSTIAAMSDL